VGVYNDTERAAIPEWPISAMFPTRTYDPLTGLLSRAGLAPLITGHATSPFGVVHADVDHMKCANDTYGHQAVDEMLVAIAQRCNDLCAQGVHGPLGRFAARLGGDEFTLFLPGVEDIADVQAVAVTLLRRFDEPIVVSAGFVLDGVDTTIDARLSVGIALAPAGELLEGLRIADDAMFEAKRRGRGLAVCRDPEWHAS
jgi:diguanylate cyclase (GGDEF)-like protein